MTANKNRSRTPSLGMSPEQPSSPVSPTEQPEPDVLMGIPPQPAEAAVETPSAIPATLTTVVRDPFMAQCRELPRGVPRGYIGQRSGVVHLQLRVYADQSAALASLTNGLHRDQVRLKASNRAVTEVTHAISYLLELLAEGRLAVLDHVAPVAS